ncbi:MAG: hypothetical protein ACYCSS_13440 [Sulfuriferula sp.]
MSDDMVGHGLLAGHIAWKAILWQRGQGWWHRNSCEAMMIDED